MRLRLTLLASLSTLSLSLTACAGESSLRPPEYAEASGKAQVVDPAGNTVVIAPGSVDPIDRLAASLCDNGHRVDLGSFFERDEIAGIPGQRVALDGDVVDTWTFDSAAEARAFAARFSADGRLFDGEELPWLETTHLWVRGPMVMMYIGDAGGTIAAVDQVAQRRTEHPESRVVDREELEHLVRREAGDRLAVAPAGLRLLRTEQVVFSDACLDVPESAEVCHDVRTHGYRFVFLNGSERIVAHTDQAGSRIFFPGQGG